MVCDCSSGIRETSACAFDMRASDGRTRLPWREGVTHKAGKDRVMSETDPRGIAATLLQASSVAQIGAARTVKSIDYKGKLKFGVGV